MLSAVRMGVQFDDCSDLVVLLRRIVDCSAFYRLPFMADCSVGIATR